MLAVPLASLQLPNLYIRFTRADIKYADGAQSTAIAQKCGTSRAYKEDIVKTLYDSAMLMTEDNNVGDVLPVLPGGDSAFPP